MFLERIKQGAAVREEVADGVLCGVGDSFAIRVEYRVIGSGLNGSGNQSVISLQVKESAIHE
jgi:hypothetical protein